MLIENEATTAEQLLLLKQPECIEVSEAIRATGMDDLTRQVQQNQSMRH